MQCQAFNLCRNIFLGLQQGGICSQIGLHLLPHLSSPKLAAQECANKSTFTDSHSNQQIVSCQGYCVHMLKMTLSVDENMLDDIMRLLQQVTKCRSGEL